MPQASERKISHKGLSATFIIVMASPEVRDCATDSETEKTISPMASSIATTGKRVEVIGPCALYWRTTISVAAGAVAVAIAPKTRQRAGSKPAISRAASTRITADKAWKKQITVA